MPTVSTRLRRTGAALVCAALVACDGSGVLTPPAGLTHAIVTPSCGAADGATLNIVLRGRPIDGLPVSEPYLQVSLAGSIAVLEGRSWRIPEPHDNWAAFRASPANDETASTGTVTILSVADDSTVTGNLVLSFPGGRAIRGGFSARWVPRPANYRCG